MESAHHKIQILYFAELRDVTDVGSEFVNIGLEATPVSVYQELCVRYGFDLPIKNLRFAVNENFVASDLKLKSGDILALIPPVNGG